MKKCKKAISEALKKGTIISVISNTSPKLSTGSERNLSFVFVFAGLTKRSLTCVRDDTLRKFNMTALLLAIVLSRVDGLFLCIKTKKIKE